MSSSDKCVCGKCGKNTESKVSTSYKRKHYCKNPKLSVIEKRSPYVREKRERKKTGIKSK